MVCEGNDNVVSFITAFTTVWSLEGFCYRHLLVVIVEVEFATVTYRRIVLFPAAALQTDSLASREEVERRGLHHSSYADHKDLGSDAEGANGYAKDLLHVCFLCPKISTVPLRLSYLPTFASSSFSFSLSSLAVLQGSRLCAYSSPSPSTSCAISALSAVV